jgi:hypothetical protein
MAGVEVAVSCLFLVCQAPAHAQREELKEPIQDPKPKTLNPEP